MVSMVITIVCEAPNEVNKCTNEMRHSWPAVLRFLPFGLTCWHTSHLYMLCTFQNGKTLWLIVPLCGVCHCGTRGNDNSWVVHSHSQSNMCTTQQPLTPYTSIVAGLQYKTTYHVGETSSHAVIFQLGLKLCKRKCQYFSLYTFSCSPQDCMGTQVWLEFMYALFPSLCTDLSNNALNTLLLYY